MEKIKKEFRFSGEFGNSLKVLKDIDERAVKGATIQFRIGEENYQGVVMEKADTYFIIGPVGSEADSTKHRIFYKTKDWHDIRFI